MKDKTARKSTGRASAASDLEAGQQNVAAEQSRADVSP